MAAQSQVDLRSRIQGFGNVNPPPLEDDTAKTVAKRAVGRLGDMLGEEVMLTVEDFKEKGVVGAAKDAVADAGDLLIDGASWLVGFVRGDPPPEQDEEAEARNDDAQKALAHGPGGAAYGMAQASPTGGINAVWVMPDEADPATLHQLAQQGGGLAAQVNDPRVPKNIQPYQSPAEKNIQPYQATQTPGAFVPGQPYIAPYQPLPAGGARGGFSQGALQPGPSPGAFCSNAGRFGSSPGAFGPTGGSLASSSTSGPRSTIDQIAKGDLLATADVAKRLVSQCSAAKTGAKELGQLVVEKARRLYLALDGNTDPDAPLAQLLSLTDSLSQSDSAFARDAVKVIKEGACEELRSLQSSAKHGAAAKPMLRRLGLVEGAPEAPAVDLLGGPSAGPGPTPECDLLGGLDSSDADLLGDASAAPQGDLLGGSPAPAVATGDLLSFGSQHGSYYPAQAASADLSSLSLQPMPAPALVNPAPVGSMASMPFGAAPAAPPAKPADAFSFVGDELSKAGSKTQ